MEDARGIAGTGLLGMQTHSRNLILEFTAEFVKHKRAESDGIESQAVV
jgi:hypothetical protein